LRRDCGEISTMPATLAAASLNHGWFI